MSLRRKELGRGGEERVDSLFASWGWKRIVANARVKGGEIDRIYRLARQVCVVEVKTLVVPRASTIEPFLGGDFLAGALKPRQCRNLACMGSSFARTGVRVHVRVFRVFIVGPGPGREAALNHLQRAYGGRGPVKVIELGPDALGLSLRPEFVPRGTRTNPFQIEIG